MATNKNDFPTFKFIYEDTILFRERVFVVKAASQVEALLKIKQDDRYSSNLKLKGVGVVDAD